MAISYKKLWKLLIDKDMKKGDLQKAAGISWASVTKLSKGEPVSMEVLMKICHALECNIGDMMDIRAFETKELIQRGLSNINNPFILGMIDKDNFHFSGIISQHKIAFYLVPLINAVTRVGSLNDKMVLFEALLNHRANVLIPSTKRGEKGKQEKIVT